MAPGIKTAGEKSFYRIHKKPCMHWKWRGRDEDEAGATTLDKNNWVRRASARKEKRVCHSRDPHYNTKGNDLLDIIIIEAKFRIFIETLRQQETTTIPFLAENVLGQHTPFTWRMWEHS